MEQRKILLEKIVQIMKQLSMEELRKVYAFMRTLLEIRRE